MRSQVYRAALMGKEGTGVMLILTHGREPAEGVLVAVGEHGCTLKDTDYSTAEYTVELTVAYDDVRGVRTETPTPPAQECCEGEKAAEPDCCGGPQCHAPDPHG